MWTDGMAYVRTCASGTAEWRGMNRRKGVESKEGMEEMSLLYALYSVEFQRNVAFLFARTIENNGEMNFCPGQWPGASILDSQSLGPGSMPRMEVYLPILFFFTDVSRVILSITHLCQ